MSNFGSPIQPSELSRSPNARFDLAQSSQLSIPQEKLPKASHQSFTASGRSITPTAYLSTPSTAKSSSPDLHPLRSKSSDQYPVSSNLVNKSTRQDPPFTITAPSPVSSPSSSALGVARAGKIISQNTSGAIDQQTGKFPSSPKRPVPVPNRSKKPGLQSRFDQNATVQQTSFEPKRLVGGNFNDSLPHTPTANLQSQRYRPSEPSTAADVENSTLGLDHASVREKISPFSTPPSSDDSPPQGMMRESVDHQNPSKSMSSQGSYFPKSSKQESEKPPIRSGSYQFNRPIQKSPMPTHHSTYLGVRTNDIHVTRPELPPRTVLNTSRPSSTLPPEAWRKVPKQNLKEAVVSPESRNLIPPISPAQRTMQESLPSVTSEAPKIMPPPRRTLPAANRGTTQGECVDLSRVQSQNSSLGATIHGDRREAVGPGNFTTRISSGEYPDNSSANRRPPLPEAGSRIIDTNYDAKIFDICANYVCTAGYIIRVWDLATGKMVLNLGYGDREVRVTALAFKSGATIDEEGSRLWVGTNNGELQEIDIVEQKILCTKPNAHNRREIVRIYRHQNCMWTLDEDGRVCIWPPDPDGLPNLEQVPSLRKVPRGHTFSIVIEGLLWLATGRDITIFRPSLKEDVEFNHKHQPATQIGVGEITCGAVLGSQQDRVYFGHTDGKVTIYSTTDCNCLGLVNLSGYRITSLAGVGAYIWAGYNTGTIHVYDTQSHPWQTRKEWNAHNRSVMSLSVDRSSLWRFGVLRVASLGNDNAIRIWDGLLETDWLGIHQ